MTTKDKKDPIQCILDALSVAVRNLIFYNSQGFGFREETAKSRRELISICELFREISIPKEKVKDVVEKLEEVSHTASDFLCPIIYFGPLILEVKNNLK